MNRHHRRANARLQQTSNNPRAASLLQVGIKHHLAGQMAEACYRRVLAVRPDHADALHLLGVIAHQAKRYGVAVELIRKALGQDGQNADYLSNLGAVLRDQGKFDEAVAAHRHAIEIKPDLVQAHSNLGVALRDQGKLDEAIAAYRRAIRIKPDYAEAHSNLGAALRDRGQFDEAVAAYHRAIRIRPDYAEAYSNLGNVLRDQGQFDQAVAAHNQAIQIKPGYVEAYFNLGAVLRDRGNLIEAEAAYRRAIRGRPDYAAAYSNLGATLRELGKPEEAVAACRQAIVLKPNFVEAHNNLAVALTELGRLKEGRAVLEQAVRLAPRNAKCRRNLGEIVRFVAGDPRLAELEQLAAESASLSVGDRIELHFALAKAYEDVGRHPEAFRQWLDGNALKRRQIAYNEAATLGALNRARAVFTSELIRTHRNAGQPSPMPVFIVGMPRSGTTLVEQILASHPQVFGGGELTHFGEAVKGTRRTFGGSAIFPELVSGMTDDDFRDVGARYLSEIERLAPAAARITDKSPGNFIFAGLIHLALPNATIIHTVRDPVDTCISCFSKLFAEGQKHTYDLAELGRYYRHYQTMMAHWHRVLPPGRILDVRYEDVVADLERTARRIVAHCGLGWDARCLAFHQTERPIRTASATQVRQPIYNHAIGRWRAFEGFVEPLLTALEGAAAPSVRPGD